MPRSSKSLDEYRRKRDFSQTPEPAPPASAPAATPEEKQGQIAGLFVIQKHAARRLHYDLRLEIGGVLKSWALPKGPSLNPKDKRLAVMTEDHPLEYADFEGIIPEGQYGAGTAIVWDKGTYRIHPNHTHKSSEDSPAPITEALESGRVALWLEGQKLQGGFALIRTQRGPDGKPNENNWLFFKMADDFADSTRDITAERPESVLSGRTLEDVQAQGG